MSKFGDFVRVHRLKLEMTGVMFAKKVGVTTVQLANVETGKCLPKIGSVGAYANALNINKEKLLEIWIKDYEAKRKK